MVPYFREVLLNYFVLQSMMINAIAVSSACYLISHKCSLMQCIYPPYSPQCFKIKSISGSEAGAALYNDSRFV